MENFVGLWSPPGSDLCKWTWWIHLIKWLHGFREFKEKFSTISTVLQYLKSIQTQQEMYVEHLCPPSPTYWNRLDVWPTDLIINREYLLIKDYLSLIAWSFWGKAFLSYQLHKVKGYQHTDMCKTISPSFFWGGGWGIKMFFIVRVQSKLVITRSGLF